MFPTLERAKASTEGPLSHLGVLCFAQVNHVPLCVSSSNLMSGSHLFRVSRFKYFIINNHIKLLEPNLILNEMDSLTMPGFPSIVEMLQWEAAQIFRPYNFTSGIFILLRVVH